MINKKEIISVLIITAVLTISVSLITSWKVFFFTMLAIFLIIAINIAAKKFLAYYLDSDIEVKMWEIKRYGFKPHKEFKRAFPAGIFLPILVSAITFGNLMWLASLVFEVKPKVYRAAKRHGLYSYSDITEYQIGLIAAAGIVANLIFAGISYFAGWGIFTRLSVWYAFFNMIPISDLDGNKIFFGNLVLWSFLASVAIIAVAYAFILV
jgi:hypothetical protein